MKKIIIVIIIGVILALASAGYYWWQKREAGQPSLSLKEANISCESLKNIPSVEYAPAEVKEQFIKCFPDRVGGVTSPVSVPSGVSGAPVKGTSPSLEASPSSCDPFAAMAQCPVLLGGSRFERPRFMRAM